jgi:hypothetical protein
MVSDETLLNLIQDLKSLLKELIDDLKKERSNENEASANPRSNLKKELQDFVGKHAPKEDKNQAEHNSLLNALLRIINEFLAANGFEDEEEDSWSDDSTHLTGLLDHLLEIIAAMEKELQKRANPTPKEGSSTPTATTPPSTEAAPKAQKPASTTPASTTPAPGEGVTKPAMLMTAVAEPEESTELQLNTIKGAWAFQKDHRPLFERAENLIRNEWGYNDPGIMAGSDRLFGADAWLCLSALNGPNDTKWLKLDPDNKLSEKERENAITAAKTLSKFYANFHPKILGRDAKDAKHREVYQKVGGLGYTLLCHGVAQDKFSFSEELINSGDIEAIAARLGGALYD